ncbi:MAG: biotin--[acetyl-CoA-carboxylase] ligase [Deltaproteobacteria bacterium]|nr:biotin--[acetyl-CoA-carboxylase] ligase [Candidatus Anaeroferrophillacea bacterium]
MAPPGRPGCRVVHLERVDSTNRHAARLAAAGAEHGTLVVADEQFAGRGRRGREWSSPPGRNLAFSLILRPALPDDRVPLLALVAGISLADTIGRRLPEVRVKWPNDVWCRGGKLAGILCEAGAPGPAGRAVIMGIGVNVNSRAEDFAPEIPAVSMARLAGRQFDLPLVLRHLVEGLDRDLEIFSAEGFGGRLLERFRHRCLLTGKRVAIEAGDRTGAGMVVGVDAGGRLLLDDDFGCRRFFAAGEASILSHGGCISAAGR